MKTYAGHIQDTSVCNPAEIVSQKEQSQQLRTIINKLLDSILSDKQRNQIKKYYFENKTLLQIGKNTE